MTTTERKNEREFGIYNSTKDKFHNLDYLNSFDDQDEFEEEPKKKFTYEECERFIVHKEDKEDLTILNLLQPKFLLSFHLDYLRKQFIEKYKIEMEKQNRQKVEQFQKLMQPQEETLKSKGLFYNDLQSWELDVNSVETQMSGQFGEKLKNKPTIESYNLRAEHFTEKEKVSLKKTYEFVL